MIFTQSRANATYVLSSGDLVVTDILGTKKGIEALVETDSSKKLNRANPNRTDLQPFPPSE